jgi:hypothetical protein
VDLPLAAFGISLVLFAGVVAGLGASYRPEFLPFVTARPHSFKAVATVSAVIGALLLGIAVAGLGGFLVAAALLVAIRVARS